MAKNRRNTNPLDKLEDKYGIARTDEEIDIGVKRDERLIAKLVPRNPFLPNERGWYLWLSWAKLEAHGKERGDAPELEQVKKIRITSSRYFNIEPGPFKIFKSPKVPRRHKNISWQ